MQTRGPRAGEYRYNAPMPSSIPSPIALLLGATLVFAPLFQSGKSPLALLVLELLALAHLGGIAV